MPKGVRSEWLAALVLVAAVALRLFASAALPLSPNETQIWQAAQQPAFAYPDGPGGAPLLLRLSAALGARDAQGLRALGVLLGVAVVALAYGLARRLFGPASAFFGAALLAVSAPFVPPSQAGADGMTTSLALGALLGALWLAAPCLEEGRLPGGWRSAALGLTLAILQSARYDAILAVLALGIIWLWRWRGQLGALARDPRMALLLALVVCGALPALMWNAAHGWAGYRSILTGSIAAVQAGASSMARPAALLERFGTPLLAMAALGLLRLFSAKGRLLLVPGLVLIIVPGLGTAARAGGLAVGLALCLLAGADVLQRWAAARIERAPESSGWRYLWAVARLAILAAVSVALVLGAGMLGRVALLRSQGDPLTLRNLINLEAFGPLSYLAVAVIMALALLILRALQPKQVARDEWHRLWAAVGLLAPGVLLATLGLGTWAALATTM